MTPYQHTHNGQPIDLPALGKIVCVGRNYAKHAQELGNPIPKEPLLFIKPATSAVPMAAPIQMPQGHGPCHHEVELALLIGKTLRCANPEDVDDAVWGYGVGLDLTLRQLQSALKEKGHPWERAKSFDGACPLSEFEPGVVDWASINIRLTINDQVRQDGQTAHMLVPVRQLVAHISQTFTLNPGDVVLTGTPAGVGPLASGDRLRCELVGLCAHDTTVA